MLNWTLTFLIVAIIAGLLGFTGITGVATEMAKVVFAIALVVWIAGVIFEAFKKRRH